MAATINLENKHLESDSRSRNQGQWMAFIIAIISFIIAGYAISRGSEATAAIVSFFGVATTIIAGFLRFRPVRQADNKPASPAK